MHERKEKAPAWIELNGDGVQEFQKILRMLVEYDERTGRLRHSTQPEQHYLRKAFALCAVSELRIFARALGAFNFAMVGEWRSTEGYAASAWIHEDGICMEREQFPDPAHPVHFIVCLSDLLPAGRSVDFCGAASPGEQAASLMFDEAIYQESA